MVANWVSDELILICAAIAANDWNAIRADRPATRPQAEELSALLNAAPLVPPAERDPNFRSTASIQRKSYDLTTQLPGYSGKPTRGGKLDRQILRRFLEDPDEMHAVAKTIRNAILSGDALQGDIRSAEDELPEDVAAAEGRLLLASHKRRERDRKLRKAKLASVIAASRPIACEVCSFEFGKTYGPLGDGFIEVHHILPLHASGPTTTRLSDLALLCSNCHRMIHRSRPWLTPDALRTVTRTR